MLVWFIRKNEKGFRESSDLLLQFTIPWDLVTDAISIIETGGSITLTSGLAHVVEYEKSNRFRSGTSDSISAEIEITQFRLTNHKIR